MGPAATHCRCGGAARLLATLAVAAWLRPSGAGGQEPFAAGRSWEVGVGVAGIVHRDDVASPMRYGGWAPLGQVGYRREGPSGSLEVRAGATGGNLTSAITEEGLPRQSALRGWVEAEYLRVVRGRSGRTRLLAGAECRLAASTHRHYYADPGRSGARFAFLSAALAPAAGFEHRVGSGGVLSAHLSVAALAVVGRPYSDVRLLARSGLPVRAVTLDGYRAVGLAARYAVRVGRRARLSIGYRLRVERLDDAQPYRAATQSATLAAALGT